MADICCWVSEEEISPQFQKKKKKKKKKTRFQVLKDL